MASVRNPDLGKLYWEERTRIVVWRVGSYSSGCTSCRHSTDCSSWINTLKSMRTSTAGRFQVVSSPLFLPFSWSSFSLLGRHSPCGKADAQRIFFQYVAKSDATHLSWLGVMIGFYHLIYQFSCLCFARSPVILPVLKRVMKKTHNCKQLYFIGWPNLWQVNHLLLCKLDRPTTWGACSISCNL